MDTIEIPLSKKKIILAILGSLLFVFIGIDFIRNTATYASWRASKEAIIISGISSVLFFGTCAIIATKKLLSRQIGLVIDKNCFIDKSSAASLGEVLWKDVEAITSYSIVNQQFIGVELKHPEKYINTQTSLFKRKLMLLNYRMTGMPSHISANTLMISHAELLKLMKKHFNLYNQTLKVEA
ncbi:STM3941 family protein [Flavobacterium sp.]|uniref:STM3941 family protein n=1 Tax=Flavobacterium sp. TaxID=239 RepID=UPI0026208B18|nr:STM3941 family protein [Flavobacterium sp.]